MNTRRVQFITIPLKALASLPQSVSARRETIKSSKILEEDGPLPWIAHHAVRIEVGRTVSLQSYLSLKRRKKSPGSGINDSETTWAYFGLTNDGHVILDESPFTPDTIMDAGRTKWDTKAIRRAAKAMVQRWGEYDLRKNNCQHFALRLAFDICRWCQVNQVLIDAQIKAGIHGVGNPVPVPPVPTGTLDEIPPEDRDCLPEA
ncbi:hypothetical protein BJX70DRAFT_399104 [Aspergillus crustosus]